MLNLLKKILTSGYFGLFFAFIFILLLTYIINFRSSFVDGVNELIEKRSKIYNVFSSLEQNIHYLEESKSGSDSVKLIQVIESSLREFEFIINEFYSDKSYSDYYKQELEGHRAETEVFYTDLLGLKNRVSTGNHVETLAHLGTFNFKGLHEYLQHLENHFQNGESLNMTDFLDETKTHLSSSLWFGFISSAFGILALLLISALYINQTKGNQKTAKENLYFHNALQNMNDSVAILDTEKRIVYANKTFVNMYGYNLSDLQGKSISQFFETPADEKSIIQMEEKYGSWSGEILTRTRFGGLITMLLSTSVLKTPEGTTEAYIGIAKDISDLKKQQKTLDLMYKVVEKISCANNIEDLIISIYEPVCEILGTRDIYFIYNRFFRSHYIYPGKKSEYQDHAFEHYLINLTNKSRSVVRLSGIKADLNVPPAYVDWLGVPLNIGNENLGLMVVQSFSNNLVFSLNQERVLYTISNQIAQALERFNKDDELKASEEKFKTMAESVSSAILIFNNRRLVYINSAAARITGMSEEEVFKQIANLEIVHPSNKLEIYKYIVDFNEKELSKISFDTRILGKYKDEKWVHCIAKKITLFGKPHVLVTVNDITARKKAESEIGKYVKELQESKDLIEQNSEELSLLYNSLSVSERELKKINADKDKFISILSHDLRSPFNSLLGFTNLLYDDIDELSKDEISAFCRNINISAKNLLKFLDNLLEWSKVSSGRIDFNPEVFNLHETVKIIVRLLEGNAISKQITLMVDIDENISVFGDRKMISSVIQNLVSNAIKFTDRHGKILVSASKKDICTHVCVTDTGIGMTAADAAKLFRIDAQHTTAGTDNEKGTGLGLLLCKEFIEKHGGQIWVQTEINQGSSFTFSLPHLSHV